MIKYIHIYRNILLVIVPFTMSLLFSQQISAEEVSLHVSPSLLQIRTKTEDPVKTTIILTNPTKSEATYTLQIQAITADITGKTRILPEQSPEATEFQSFSQQIQIENDGLPIDQITLGPKQKKKLQLVITTQAKDKAKDYYFSLIFISKSIDKPETSGAENEHKAFAAIETGIALPVLLSLQQSEIPKGTLTAFSTQSLRTDGPVPFTIRVKNDSHTFVTAQGALSIHNLFGQRIGQVQIPKTPILKNSERIFFTRSGMSSFDNDISSFKTIWPEKFILGGYTGQVNITLSTHASTGTVMTDSVSFFALPIKALVMLIVIILVTSYCIYRFRKLNR